MTILWFDKETLPTTITFHHLFFLPNLILFNYPLRPRPKKAFWSCPYFWTHWIVWSVFADPNLALTSVITNHTRNKRPLTWRFHPPKNIEIGDHRTINPRDRSTCTCTSTCTYILSNVAFKLAPPPLSLEIPYSSHPKTTDSFGQTTTVYHPNSSVFVPHSALLHLLHVLQKYSQRTGSLLNQFHSGFTQLTVTHLESDSGLDKASSPNATNTR